MSLEQDDYVYPGTRFTKCGHVSGQGQGMTLRDWFAGHVARCVSRADPAGRGHGSCIVTMIVRTAGMSPKTLTRMYLIWCHCTPLGWGQTYQDAADALDIHSQSVVRIAALMGWQGRFRSETANFAGIAGADDGDEIITTLRGLAAE